MQTDNSIIKRKCALICDLSKRMKEKSYSFGKTILQKEIFLLQELYTVPCGYKFELYTYGPFSSELLNDLDYVTALNGVNVTYWGPYGYQIDPGDSNSNLREMDLIFLETFNDKINKVIDEFGKFSAKELELISTIIYCDRNVEKESTKEKFIQVIKGIKPKFSDFEIEAMITDLEKKAYIRIRSIE